MDKLSEECAELREAVALNDGVFGELGDVLFAAVNAARLLHVDPEAALHASCEKFTRRFEYMEKKAVNHNGSLENTGLDVMEEYYSEAKRNGL
jgi:tetrapyrrole methylase family protein/MazG family protein